MVLIGSLNYHLTNDPQLWKESIVLNLGLSTPWLICNTTTKITFLNSVLMILKIICILYFYFSFLLYQQDTKIASLERNIRDLEDEIQMLKANGVLNTEDREEEIKQIEVYKSHSKFMKTKVRSRVINFYVLSVTRKLQFTYVLFPNTHIICFMWYYLIYGQQRRMQKIFSSDI